jgi:hypothetical protein
MTGIGVTRGEEAARPATVMIEHGDLK